MLFNKYKIRLMLKRFSHVQFLRISHVKRIFFFFQANPSPKLTPVTRKSLRERKSTKAVRETPTLSRKAVQNSIISLTTKSPKKAALKTSQSLTNANEEVPDRTSSTIRASKNEKRRKESESSSATGRPKKRKTDIGDLVNKIEKVNLAYYFQYDIQSD